MTRKGKIARLPQDVREELNRRLADGEPGKGLVAWLNGHPKVKAVLAAQFGGQEVSEPNLSRWKTGGFKDWLAEEREQSQSRELMEEAKDLAATSEEPFTNHLSTMLAARYAVAMAQWKGPVTDEFRQKLKALGTLCHDVTRLRREDHQSLWIELEQERMELLNRKEEFKAARRGEQAATNS